ncbi:hypothetical protein B6U91_01580 [Candidatus Pacearchaeota archaeon ex4484_71]|nr:MAG: hypothetical protein B6U91_01580 [Candidatus Pacearchaeota archaeon ex4484_71]
MDKDVKKSGATRYIVSAAARRGVTPGISENSVYMNNSFSSREEADNYRYFVSEVLDKFGEDVREIGFYYKEKDKEIPLSFGKGLLKRLGASVKQKVKEGELKYFKIHPKLIRSNNYEENSVAFVIPNEEWGSLKEIQNNTLNFEVRSSFLPEGLSQQVKIPLWHITEIGFKGDKFLDSYMEEVKITENVSKE